MSKILPSTTPHILLLGGHGKVSLFLTPLLLRKSYKLTSLIRDEKQKPDILATYNTSNEKTLDFHIASLDEVKSEEDAGNILKQVKPDWVVWCAGAGGKGGAPRTNAIDRDACKAFIRASISTPSITKFLLVSALSSRRHDASWWDDKSRTIVNKMNTQILPVYYDAKLDADETLAVLGEERRAKDAGFQWISLRPGGLSDEKGTGKVNIGKIQATGMVPREDVAGVAAKLLDRDDTNGWFDLLGGEEPVDEAVERVVKEKIDAIEGESLEEMKGRIS